MFRVFQTRARYAAPAKHAQPASILRPRTGPSLRTASRSAMGRSRSERRPRTAAMQIPVPVHSHRPVYAVMLQMAAHVVLLALRCCRNIGGCLPMAHLILRTSILSTASCRSLSCSESKPTARYTSEESSLQPIARTGLTERHAKNRAARWRLTDHVVLTGERACVFARCRW